MKTQREKINCILDEIENKAYRRGWKSAMKEIKKIVALERLTNRQEVESSKEEAKG